MPQSIVHETDGAQRAESTLMFDEARSSAAAVERLVRANSATVSGLVRRLQTKPPPVVVTMARGSSDHAATYAKYLFETLLGIPVSSGAMSVASIYEARVARSGALCLAISQSGRSPDLLAGVEAHKKAGSYVVALVNDEASPLASIADLTLPLCAGTERSVAATKSYIATLAALALIAARWGGDSALETACLALPQTLAQAFELDWSAGVEAFAPAKNLFVLGRGWSLGIAQEAALKLKETCGLHAEAFSAAEVIHGPMAIIGKDFPILGFPTSDSAGDGLCDVASTLADRGADVSLADPRTRTNVRNIAALSAHPAIEPILMIQSFYRFANALSVRRGFHPDTPPYLAKITKTL